MAEKTTANIGFEKQLWDAACVLCAGGGSLEQHFLKGAHA